MSLEKILQAARRSGGTEVRLVPGRRTVIVTSAGEGEITGPPHTSLTIAQLVGPFLPQSARQALAAGRADWWMTIPEMGQIFAEGEQGADGATFTFTLGTAAAEVPAPAPVATRPAAPSSTGLEIESLFRLLVEMNASDLHISVGSPPSIRHDGDMKTLPGRSTLTPDDTKKLLWPIVPQRSREEFERRHDTDFAYEVPGVARYRCNLFMDRKGMGGVFRTIPTKILTADEMGLSKEILQLCHLPKGLVLVTGPTGSGKSTTLAALVDYVNRVRTDHIVTIEDPIEFVHENNKCFVNQRQVGEHTDSFKNALRAALREDPDVVLVGEMRDLDTIAIAIETAETGHLVFGTLHTSSAPSTVDRIIDQFPADRQSQIRVMLAESLKGVVSQILCKKIGGGRVPAFEILIGTPPVANLIREAKIFQIPSIMQTGKRYGMCMMNDSLVDLVKRKVVDPQEAYAKASDKLALLASFRKNAIDTSWAPAETPPAPPPAG
jgi:twitching motility protein PilT